MLLKLLPAVAIGLIVAFAVTRTLITDRPGESDPPNVVVILVDTLRADYLGIYGHEPETTPFLTWLAGRSTVFTRAFSTSTWTAPSTASLFTSTYPTEHGVVQGMFAHQEHVRALEADGQATLPLNRIPSQLSTLPEHLKAHGYTTFGMASNRNIGDEMGFTRGFDRFRYAFQTPVEEFYETLNEWQGDIKDSQPYFVYLHLNDVHMPYDVREPYLERLHHAASGDKLRYLSEIGHVDHYLHRIYRALGIKRDTVFIVLSDHGEEFYDHGGIEHGPNPQLYRELNQVVMLMHGPQYGIQEKRIDSNVSLIDVAPTILDLIGLPSMEQARGETLSAFLSDADENSELENLLKHRTVFAHRAAPFDPMEQHWAATREHWKLYEPWERGAELYDHRVDFPEQNNVIDEYEHVASELAAELEKFKQHRVLFPDTEIEVPLDQELLETLESLGYVE